jgi:hypothetical protein
MTFLDVEKKGVEVSLAPVEEGQQLGVLFWATIRELRVDPTALQHILNYTIGKEYMPTPLTPRDAFRRATDKLAKKGIELADGTTLNLLVRSIRNSGEHLVRHLVREIVDANNRRLEYTAIIEFTIDHGGMPANRRICPSLKPAEVPSLTEFAGYFHQETSGYSARFIRLVIQDFLKSVQALTVRPSGGVYFIPAFHWTQVEALKRFILDLAQYQESGPSRAFTVPIVSDAEQREMVEISLQDQVEKASQEMMREAKTIITTATKKGKSIGTERFKTFVRHSREMADLANTYRAFLGLEQDKLEGTLEVVAQTAEIMATNASITLEEAAA